RVDIVVGAVVQGDPEIDDGVTRQEAAAARVLNALFHGRNERWGNGSSENVVHELEIRTAAERLNADLAVAELAVSAGLLLVPSVRLGRRLDGLAVRNTRRLEVHVHPKPAFQLRDGDLDVHLPLSRQQKL